MWMRLLQYLLLYRIMHILMKHGVSRIIWHKDDVYAVYYDEVRDEIHHLSLTHTTVQEREGVLIYQPIVNDDENMDGDWIFLQLSEEVRPMSHYSDLIFRKLVEKVRSSKGGY